MVSHTEKGTLEQNLPNSHSFWTILVEQGDLQSLVNLWIKKDCTISTSFLLRVCFILDRSVDCLVGGTQSSHHCVSCMRTSLEPTRRSSRTRWWTVSTFEQDPTRPRQGRPRGGRPRHQWRQSRHPVVLLRFAIRPNIDSNHFPGRPLRIR